MLSLVEVSQKSDWEINQHVHHSSRNDRKFIEKDLSYVDRPRDQLEPPIDCYENGTSLRKLL